MKKFIIAVCMILLVLLAADIAYYRLGIYFAPNADKPVSTFVRTNGKQIMLDTGNGYQPFEIRGVNMGSGIPGEWATDFAIDEDTYFRWFGYIKEMGANTVRVYTVQNSSFYKAFYRFNKDNPDPLYLIHGVWVNDYIQNSRRDAYDKEFFDALLNDCKVLVDVLHGKKTMPFGSIESAGSGSYRKDISPWVIGYILGVEWEDVTVVYTDKKYAGNEEYRSYQGRYLRTTDEASPFEAMLAQVGDKIISYESNRYHQQRLVAFSNWPATDPFHYPKRIEKYFMKCAEVDTEHIKSTKEFLSGQFASYHVYPYYPDYLEYIENLNDVGISDVSQFIDENGALNTYRAYLSILTNHHTMPVVISEFGVSAGRGMAQRDQNTGRNQGHMSEKEQGEALVKCYKDIMSAGCAGGCVFSWQDEWFKRTWNTMYAVDLRRTPYWSDYQTNEQYFGILSFDPGKERSVCYVDGDISEWTENDVVFRHNDSSVSVKYDERFIYFLVYQKGHRFGSDTLYLPIDVTPKSGSNYCENYNLKFDRECDFLIVLNGEQNSRVQVQQRYEALRANYSVNVYNYDTYITGNIPDRDSPWFTNIDMILQTATPLLYFDNTASAEVYETGKLTFGNANPESPDFNSLADFINNGEYIELKLPWQLLNFADPSRMKVHDDYYDGNYGVEYIDISHIYLGLLDGSESERTVLSHVKLSGWNKKITYHERLKSSYYILQDYWTKVRPAD